MASLYGLDRAFHAYVSDDGNTYQVSITQDDALAGGFGGAVAVGTNPPYPRGWKMRHMYGVGPAGQRTKTPVKDPSTGPWLSDTSFTKHAIVCAIEGRIGERRTTKG